MKKLVSKILSLNDSPKRIARGFAMGSFIGMLPIPGFQMLLSLGLASIFKQNRKAACIAVFNTNVLTGSFVFAFNFWLGKTVLGLKPVFTMPDRLGFDFIKQVFLAGTDVFFSMLVGGIITGILAYVISYIIVQRLVTRKLTRHD